ATPRGATRPRRGPTHNETTAGFGGARSGPSRPTAAPETFGPATDQRNSPQTRPRSSWFPDRYRPRTVRPGRHSLPRSRSRILARIEFHFPTIVAARAVAVQLEHSQFG